MKGLQLLTTLILKGRSSKFWLRILNFVLGYIIPFNRPHGFRIEGIGDDVARIVAPYRRSNHNHIRGIHACAIATIGEFAAGILLLSKLDPAHYRLIMSKLEVEYFYQAKQKIVAQVTLSNESLQKMILDPLKEEPSCYIVMMTEVHDREGNAVAEVHTTWQIKRWDKVKTQVK